MAESNEILEGKYIRADKLQKAIHNFLRNKDKADMYREIAEIYKSLGDYKDSPAKYEACLKKAAEHDELAKDEKEVLPTVPTEKKDKKNHHVGLIILIVCGVLVLGAIGGAIYFKTQPGRYARASYYEKVGNYEKAYKMFKGLEDENYSDSKELCTRSRYEYAGECVKNKDYKTALKTYQLLGDYQDSVSKLAEVELQIIKTSKIGSTVFFGEYHWLLVDKNGSDYLLVKLVPVLGLPYNEEAKATTWHDCTLRKYLNGEFLNESFSTEAQKYIADTEITISDNADYKTVGGESTTDKVFILNSQQELKYQKTLNNNDRTCWLIEPGKTQSTAQFSAYGHIMTYGYPVSAINLYARPALWVSAE